MNLKKKYDHKNHKIYLGSVFNLNKVFAKLSENELEKFNAFEVLPVE